MMEPFW